ncbi:hypothetical protein LguiA_030409 [Lonicera macranthoides]
MVPSNRDSPNQQPCFPGCLEWVMENQKADGSWGLSSNHPSLVKDSLSSTLACVLALQNGKSANNLFKKVLKLKFPPLFNFRKIYVVMFGVIYTKSP